MATTLTEFNARSKVRTTSSKSLVFIDPSVEDYQTLASGIAPGSEAIVLNRGRNGIEQIAEVLQKYAATGGSVDAVHIISHGSSGSLQLGSTTLNSENLSQYSSQLQQWQSSLSAKADLFLYGCDVAAREGANFVEQLGQLTGTDVAASTDKTGSSALGGNWNFEFSKGEIETPLALQPEAMASYKNVLAILTVTTNSDSGPGSLREALANASAGDTIVFAASLANQTITLTSGQLAVNKNLIIDGAAAPNLTISGNNASRVMFIQGSTNVTLRNLTIANGKVSGLDPNNEATTAGGGILTGSSSNVTLENCQINNNVAGIGGGVYAGFQSTTTVLNCKFTGNDGSLADNTERGGGGLATKSGSILKITNSEFLNNKGSYGGAVNNLLSSMTIENSRFVGNTNTSKGVGGAVYVDGANASGPNATPGPAVAGSIIIRNSLFDSNIGTSEGGAAFLFGYYNDTLLIENSTFTNNKSVVNAGGTAGSAGGVRLGNFAVSTIDRSTFANNTAADNGGAVWVGEDGQFILTNSTFYGNSAGNIGGAVLINNTATYPSKIVNTTIANNSAGNYAGAIGTFDNQGQQAITVANSIFANNTANNPYQVKQQTFRPLIDGGNNIQFPALLKPSDPNDNNVTNSITIADPKLGTLQTVDGALVIPLLAGSPAIDGGNNATAPAIDQRGQARPLDGDNNGTAIADIGAYESPGNLPEIQVLNGAIDIVDNTTTPQSFGATVVGTPTIKSFTINNLGNANLTLGSPILPAGFSLVGTAPTAIAANSQATLQIQLNAGASGVFAGDLSFANNDSNENPFNFAISGTVNPLPPTPTPTPTPTPIPVSPTPTPTPPTPTPTPPTPTPTPTPPTPTPTPPTPTPTPTPPTPTPTPPTPTPTPTPPTPTPTPPTPTPTPTPPTPTPTPPTPTPTPIPGTDNCICDLFTAPAISSASFTPRTASNTIEGTVGDENFMGTPADDEINAGSGNDVIYGMAANDNIYGSNGNDVLFGNEGTDYLEAGLGNDTVYAGKDDDVVLGGTEGSDFLRGDFGNDTVLAGVGSDTVFGGKENDTLLGEDGDDFIYGNLGDDVITGNLGNDVIFANEGADLAFGDIGEDTIYAGKDNDTLCGGDGRDLLFGNNNDDAVDGAAGDDSIYGGKGNDSVYGCEGNDSLKGDFGEDTLVGGSGSDVFILIPGLGTDTITDFQKGQDTIGLSGGLTFGQLSITSGTNSTLISVASTGEVLSVLRGVSPGTITSQDFVTL